MKIPAENICKILASSLWEQDARRLVLTQHEDPDNHESDHDEDTHKLKATLAEPVCDFCAVAVTITITFVKETILGIVAVEERPYEEYTDGNVCESVDGSSVGIWRDETADFEETAE